MEQPPEPGRARIYATNIDEDALDQARHGAYPPRQLEDVPRSSTMWAGALRCAAV